MKVHTIDEMNCTKNIGLIKIANNKKKANRQTGFDSDNRNEASNQLPLHFAPNSFFQVMRVDLVHNKCKCFNSNLTKMRQKPIILLQNTYQAFTKTQSVSSLMV